jgi:hypothetical protein
MGVEFYNTPAEIKARQARSYRRWYGSETTVEAFQYPKNGSRGAEAIECYRKRGFILLIGGAANGRTLCLPEWNSHFYIPVRTAKAGIFSDSFDPSEMFRHETYILRKTRSTGGAIHYAYYHESIKDLAEIDVPELTPEQIEKFKAWYACRLYLSARSRDKADHPTQAAWLIFYSIDGMKYVEQENSGLYGCGGAERRFYEIEREWRRRADDERRGKAS